MTPEPVDGLDDAVVGIEHEMIGNERSDYFSEYDRLVGIE